MRTDEQIEKYPALRPDLKISRQVQSERITFIVKDPLKNEYYRFDENEWGIISLFDGQSTMQQMVEKYKEKHKGLEIELETIKDYRDSLSSINLIEKLKRDQNVMLIEKMRESRNLQLLSKKGSIFYKRFPLVDPDKFFNKIISRIWFFWTKGFFIFAMTCLAIAGVIIAARWPEFQSGFRDVFSFSKLSFGNLVVLWVTIYLTIAVHELGHGLTCKRYGGEVHELGVLLLFFQPCLYANVNDAWLFDKKWKQILVTLAGGFIEVWLGSIFTMIWAMTNPLTFINTLSFQVVTICFASTVLFNFNPLIKLDGYYLLADALEIPNLRENAFKYIQYLTSKYCFRLPDQEFDATRRERRIYLTYGVLATFWITSLMLGLFGMLKGLLVTNLHEFGVLLSLFVAYKLFSGYVKKAGKFILKWYLGKRQKIHEILRQRNVRIGIGVGAVILLLAVLIPLRYTVPGGCTLEPSFVRVVRAPSDGKIVEFLAHDGERVAPGAKVVRMENFMLDYERKIASLAVDKLKYKMRNALVNDISQVPGIRRELVAKEAEFELKDRHFRELDVIYEPGVVQGAAVLSCDDEVRKVESFVKKGTDICRALGTDLLKAVVEISETQVRFIKEKDRVEFKLQASPFRTYHGTVHKIRLLGEANPQNPKDRMYQAEILISNPGELKPGMGGVAKIIAEPVSVVQNVGRKLTAFLRLDLFF